MKLYLTLNNVLIIVFLFVIFVFVDSCDSEKYIVRFTRFYGGHERLAFFKASLHTFSPEWMIERRPYVYTDSSDFDVLLVGERNASVIIQHLRLYKVIRSVTIDSMIVGLRKPLLFRNGRADGHKIPYYLQADMLWSMGVRGQGVRVGIFDTGIDEDHPHFRNAHIAECTNWTNEPNVKDTIGHGTFVAGMFVSDPDDDTCPPGIAPAVELYIFRLFTRKQTSYTSWFLDAFNYAMIRRIDLINLSIGGPDFQDQPFVEKVWELSANGILLVSAIGNDGPLYGTLNNPADQMDVIGVGGIDFSHRIARFSSRGMTTWEIPNGYGRVKPDVVTYSSHIVSSSLSGSCKTLSGTSLASPSVAAVVALLMSAVKLLINGNGMAITSPVSPASIKQALMSSAVRLPESDSNVFEQGMGMLNLIGAYRTLVEAEPQASAYPSYIDLTEHPYMWPYSAQPLYSSAMPVIVNITIINSMDVTGVFLVPPTYYAISQRNGDKISVAISHSAVLWPWSGYVALELTVPAAYSNWSGVAEGYVKMVISSTKLATSEIRKTTLKIPLRAKIIPTPLRKMRILWDQFHNLRYPPGYIPRDNVRRQEPLDWTGDHIHTNFKDSFDHIRSRGYFIEVLGHPYQCFDATNYGTLVIVDPEEEFFPEEREKLYNDVTQNGLSLIVIAEWYNLNLMRHLKFYDENTRQWWSPETGGANLPALNDLLADFNIQFSNQVLEGSIKVGKRMVQYSSGTSLARFPDSDNHISRVLYSTNMKDITAELVHGSSDYINNAAVLGLYAGPRRDRQKGTHGRISVFGDSNCLDMTYREKDCLWLWDSLLQFSRTGYISEPLLSSVSVTKEKLSGGFLLPTLQRPKDGRFARFSSVVSAIQPSIQYRSMPRCTKPANVDTRIDNTSIPDGSWYKPQPLLKRTVDIPLGILGMKNHSPMQTINLDYHRHPRAPRNVLEHIDPHISTGFLLYIICVISSSCIVLLWFCRRLRPKMREIQPILAQPYHRLVH